jgi:TATA-box binding protein (TBP) (component of TFIID and TFIIIB)
MSFCPTPFKVSTITATGSISTEIALDVFYDQLIIADHNEPSEGFVFIEYGKKNTEIQYRGFHKKLLLNRKKKKKCFDNQITVIFKMLLPSGSFQNVNVKVFKNGNIQMTGLKNIDDGRKVIDKLIEQIHCIYKKDNTIVLSIDKIDNKDYKIRLINSDFRVGLNIRNDKLNVLVQKHYNIFSSYEPCIYPAVKMQFCWNTTGLMDGRCKCDGFCKGKGTGFGEGQCKRITIATFQSGCVIITGAQTYEQIKDAYVFICGIVQKHQIEVHKVLPKI